MREYGEPAGAGQDGDDIDDLMNSHVTTILPRSHAVLVAVLAVVVVVGSPLPPPITTIGQVEFALRILLFHSLTIRKTCPSPPPHQ